MFSKYKSAPDSNDISSQKSSDNIEKQTLSNSLLDNLSLLHEMFSNSPDIVFREFFIDSLNLSAALIFIGELVDTKLVNETIITSLMNLNEMSVNNLPYSNIIDTAKQHFLKIANIDELLTVGDIEQSLLDGNAVFLLDGEVKALKMTTHGFKGRSVTEPTIERVIRGPKEAFTEDINTNTALLRRRIRSSNLKFEEFILGRQTKTKIYVTYLQGIVEESILKEVRERIGRIDIDSMLESGYLEELIEDNPYTLFPQILHSERPDRTASSILEGRVAILIDGTPFALIAPATMVMFLQTSEEYYERYPVGSIIRILRLIFFLISLLLPGVYVAIVSYHREMIPTTLLISIMQSAKGVPFPVLVEALIMEIIFEALREAGIRLPNPANQTVGIVGALVIGDAAVKAGIISSIMVIIVSVTAVASFGIPSYDMGYTIRVLRFVMLFLGGIFGLYGILIGLLVVLIHLSSLRSFGVNYLSPIAPLNFNELKDAFIRLPIWMMDKRPGCSNTNNRRRQRNGLKPKPPTR